MKFLIWYIC